MKKLSALALISILVTACSSEVKNDGQGQPTPAVSQVSASPTTAAPVTISSPLPNSPGVPGASPTLPLDKEAVAVIQKSFEERLKQNPNDPDAHYNIGLTFYQAGRYREAVAPLKRAIKQNPNDDGAHYVLGNTYDKLRQYKEAASQFREVVRLKPNDAAAQLNLGNAYAKSRQFDEAAKAYKAVVAATPNDFAAHYNLGLMYGRLNLIQEGIAELSKAIEIKPDYSEARYTLALVYHAVGDQAKAIEQYQRLKDFKSPLANDLGKKIRTTTYGEIK